MPSYLVVDDSPAIREILAEAIRRAGKLHLVPFDAEVVQADDPASALRAFKPGRFRAVFLDLMLVNGRGGLDVLRSMITQDPRVRIIVTTGLKQDHADVVQSMALGAFAMIPKPIRVDAVASVLAQIDTEVGRMRRVV